jgi:outer membrane protein TolC
VGIFKESLKIAEDQQKETEEMIRVGKTAASELVTAKAEVALRREELIVAENAMVQTRLNLLKLLNPNGAEMWEREIVLQGEPEETLIETGPVRSYVETALRMRPEMNQAKLQLERDELELVRTRNGLLPELDFFITLGSTGYASTFNRSVKDIFTGDYDVLTGVNFGISPINREARAQHLRAMLSRQQAEEAINNLAQTIEVDVRGTYLQIMSARQQVEAAKASRELQEEKLKIETAKFKVGKSIMLLVAQAQRDFLQSQIAEMQAIINYQIAVVEFYRLEGTLLLRRGIASPGGEPVKISKTAAR